MSMSENGENADCQEEPGGRQDQNPEQLASEKRAQPTETLHRWHFPRRGATVVLPESAFARMCRLAVRAAPNETGGTLVGHYHTNTATAWVERALGVRRGAQTGRTHFYRPPDEIDKQLADIYRTSDGHTHYLGEWHTHPGATPTPSQLDLRTLLELARSTAVATDTPLLFVLGGTFTSPYDIACIVVDPEGAADRGVYGGTGGRAIVSGAGVRRHEPDEAIVCDAKSNSGRGRGLHGDTPTKYVTRLSD